MTAARQLRPVPDLPPDEQPELTVVRRAGRGRLALTVASLVVVAAAVLAAVTLNAVAADDAVVAESLDTRLRAAEVVHGQLQTEVAALESPGRVAAAAEALGLVRVDHPRRLPVERLLPADGLVHERAVLREGGDEIKPLLAQD